MADKFYEIMKTMLTTIYYDILFMVQFLSAKCCQEIIIAFPNKTNKISVR